MDRSCSGFDVGKPEGRRVVTKLARGDIVWVDFGPIVDSGPAKRRPALVVQNDSLNRSRLNTVIVVSLTSRTSPAAHGANVFVSAAVTGLPKDSVVKVTELRTLDKRYLSAPVGSLDSVFMQRVDHGLRRVLGLDRGAGR